MKDWADFVVGQFIGGGAFFLGMALCLLGCFLKFLFSQSKIQSIARVTMLVGIVLVVLSACPFSFWVYGVFFALLAWAALRANTGLWRGKKTGGLLLLLLLAQSLLMVRAEVLHPVRNQRHAFCNRRFIEYWSRLAGQELARVAWRPRQA
jgi:uncharacterized membrane protein